MFGIQALTVLCRVGCLNIFEKLKYGLTNRCKVHWRESKSRDSNLPDVPAVSSGREDSGIDLELMFICGPGQGLEPGVILGHRGHGLIGELLDKNHLDSTSRLKKKTEHDKFVFYFNQRLGKQ